ncbi:hypothetical protein ZWY2020_046100 [Hordeum vulgare]|nr:hypothetical protein ZWY2020_046100 [Hordeum vulgare]
MRRRYRGLGRAFSKMRGLVVAGDEQDGEITCVHQGFRGKHQDRMAGGKEEYNDFFYSLVSTDTQVINSLPPPEEGPNLSFHTLNEQLDLLGKVLSAGDEMIGVEHLEEDSDGKALLKARCSAGLMSTFSGAGGMVYMEYKCCLSLLPFHFRLYARIQL